MLNSVAIPALIITLTTGFALVGAQTPCCPGVTYCGSQLQTMGYSGADPDTLYECGSNCEANYFFKCQYGFGCRVRDDYAFCPLYNGSKYCGYELKLFDDKRRHSEHDLYNSHGDLVQSCPDRCESGDFEADSKCADGLAQTCTVGQKYCGLELTYKKFSTWAPHTLFECSTGTISDSTRTMTSPERCRSGCVIGAPSNCNQNSPVQSPPGITCQHITSARCTAASAPIPTAGPSGGLIVSTATQTSRPAGQRCTPVPNQEYRMKHRASGLVAAIPSADNKPGSAVAWGPGDLTAPYARVKFELVGGSSNLYRIKFSHSNLQAAVYNALQTQGAKIVLASGDTPNEHFSFTPDTDGSCAVRASHSNRYWTATPNPQNQYPVGTPAVQGDTNPAHAVHFFFDPVPSETPCVPTPDREYRIKHRASNLIVAVAGGSTAGGAQVKLAPSDATEPHARVKFVQVAGSNNLYKIVFMHSNMDAAVYNALQTADAKIVQASGGTANEHFFLDATVDGSCMIRASHSNRFWNMVPTPQNQYPVGTPVVQGDKLKANLAHFFLVPA